ncbi:MAG: hypothetical protein MPN21_24125 [Thermoanaerobaculia bacterium]|nr:hypothetical protein [Thermoanaerobaculia bacterium]
MEDALVASGLDREAAVEIVCDAVPSLAQSPEEKYSERLREGLEMLIIAVVGIFFAWSYGRTFVEEYLVELLIAMALVIGALIGRRRSSEQAI